MSGGPDPQGRGGEGRVDRPLKGAWGAGDRLAVSSQVSPVLLWALKGPCGPTGGLHRRPGPCSHAVQAQGLSHTPALHLPVPILNLALEGPPHT